VSLPQPFRDYAAAWLAGRDLADRTRDDYAQILRDHINPVFGDLPVTAITPAAVREWHARLKTSIGPTMRAHAYGLLRTIMNTAVADEVIGANPCRVRGGGSVKRVKKIRPATLPELEALVKALPERYRLMALLACWCGLRFGELAELRRADVDVKNGIVHVRRGVVRINGGRKVKGPKSEAGKRDVAIPPHLMPAVKDHLAGHVKASRDALLFPAAHGGHLARRRCTGCTTRRARQLGGPISGSTICGIPGRSSPRPQGPRWPNSWRGWVTRRPGRR
jgi:integrase